MIKKYKAVFLSSLILFGFFFTAKSQVKETKAVLFDGIIAAGYVDNGAYLNFAGPGLKFTRKPVTILIGLLPSLKFKEDKVVNGATKNAIVTPSLGFGLTTAYKHLALQVPFFYNGKTAVKDGRWNVGFGIGYKL